MGSDDKVGKITAGVILLKAQFLTQFFEVNALVYISKTFIASTHTLKYNGCSDSYFKRYPPLMRKVVGKGVFMTVIN